jgi:uncharacterized protein YaiE (UPF0345 family)
VEPDPSPAGQHKVMLFAGNKVIGVAGNAAVSGSALQLQDQNSSAGQIFELDGDSIILAANRNLVVQVQNNRGANRTPLVLGNRELSDDEFWTFSAVDGSPTPPTKGFISLPATTTSAQLAAALQEASFGSVIILDGGADISIEGALPLVLKSGVTLRSNRRLTNWGARLTWSKDTTLQPGADPTMLDVRASFTRITGLRMTGPSLTEVQSGTPDWNGILADDAFPCIIDHNELSGWTLSGVGTSSIHVQDANDPNPTMRAQPVRVVRNFIHHNEMDNFGYGVVTGSGSFPLIQGNTFLDNRHAIASTGDLYTGYAALNNLVLSSVPGYQKTFTTQREQDFDMHGTGSSCGQHCGVSAGQYIDIEGNTFLGTALTLSTHYSFYLRGTPSFEASFHDNVDRQSERAAIKNEGLPSKLIVGNNHFNAANPTDQLAVGDFDGDGKDDLFLATGAAWYYSPAGKVEWHFLNARKETLGALLFGDFDGDGRTDVFTLQGRDWFVSWGGTSPWEKINESSAPFADLAVGDFDGDGKSDIFYSDGHGWYVSSGGTGLLKRFQTSSFHVHDLRFGDFNHDGKTDVLGVVSGAWQVSYGAKSSWTRLRSKLTDTVSGLMIADFDGDGKADIATIQGGSLKVSSGGTSNWKTYSRFSNSFAAVGRFQGHSDADLMVWDHNYLDILSAGKLPLVRNNPEEMR